MTRFTGIITSAFILSVTAVCLVCSGTNVYAFGRKSDICGSWNNYCNGPVGGDGPIHTPGPTGPTPEEKREQWEQQDLQEAALDANDTGIEYYERGDWANAIRYFREAMEYAPDDDEILDNLRKAEQHARVAEAARVEAERRAEEARLAEEHRKAEEARKQAPAEELVSVKHHSKTAAGLNGPAGKIESGRGFDTAGKDMGGLSATVVNVQGAPLENEPVIPKEKRTPAITKLENQRNVVKVKRRELEAKVVKLADKPKKTPAETVELAKVKQQLSDTRNQEVFLNFSITDELSKPAKAHAAKQ